MTLATKERGPRRVRDRRAPRVRPWILLPLLLVLWSLVAVPSSRRSVVSPERTRPATAAFEPPADILPAPAPGRARASVPAPDSIGTAAVLDSVESAHGAPGLGPTRETPAEVHVLVRARGGSLLSGASVELGHTAPDAEVETVHMATTDAGGETRACFPAGSLRLIAWSEDATSEPAFLELVPGTSTREVLELSPAHEVTGRVVDVVTALPIEGARVLVWTYSERDAVRTASDGSFRHRRFPASGQAEQVRVEAPGYGATVRYLSFDRDGRWELPDPLDELSVATGTGVPWIEVALVPELILCGAVTDAVGRPVAGATVEVEGYYRVLPTVASSDGAATVTDENGRFRVAGLRSDIGHSVYAFAPGTSEAALEVEAGRTGSVDLGALVVEHESVLAGVVVDPDGFPAADLRVVLTPIEGEPAEARSVAPQEGRDVHARLRFAEVETRTALDGTFLIEGLRAVGYFVRLERDRDPLVAFETGPPVGGTYPYAELALPPESITLRGRVRASRSSEGATVELRRHGRVALARVDAQGRFRVAGLDASAPYELTITGAAGELVRAIQEVWAWEELVLDLEAIDHGDLAYLADRVDR